MVKALEEEEEEGSDILEAPLGFRGRVQNCGAFTYGCRLCRTSVLWY